MAHANKFRMYCLCIGIKKLVGTVQEDAKAMGFLDKEFKSVVLNMLISLRETRRVAVSLNREYQ